MAEALVSTVLENLASFTAEQVRQEWNLVSGAKLRAEELASNLGAMKAVLEEAEKRQINDADVRHWLRRLKQMSYELDVCLDEWSTAVSLRSKLRPSEKVLFVLTHSCLRRDQLHRLGLRRRISSKIQDLNEKLSNISAEKERYSFVVRNSERVNDIDKRPPQTTSFVDASEVCGRGSEKQDLVSKVLCDSETGEVSSEREHKVIPIVGPGGIGKTTLAQLIYCDEKVTAHFDQKMWVCASNPFDEFQIAKAIVEALEIREGGGLVEFEALLQHIHKSISGRKFLLVLDDVWSEDDRKWSQLAYSLKSGHAGSKILVTTRKKEVVVMMKAEKDTITLDYLSEDVCWSIFHRQAFLGKHGCEQLEEIGRQIAHKSKGLPLVAKTLGGLMRFKNYAKEQWEEVLHNQLWELKDVENKVFVPLLFSYNDLAPLEKSCFLFCSYFPKDCVFDKDELIQLWASEGYLNMKKDYDRKGADCFESLARRSLFQNFESDEDGNIIRCKKHDIVHDFLLFLTKNEWVNMLINSNKEGIEVGDERTIHCTILVESEAQIPNSIYDMKALRTLSVRNLASQNSLIRWDLLVKLTCLRTLTLHDCTFTEVPKNIDSLIHLRYLSLCNRRNTSTKLPRRLYNLFNLQTLKLDGCVWELPKGVRKLVNLRHLCVGRRPTIVPRDLGALASLETLDHLWIARVKKPMAMKLEDLNKLSCLKGSLSIRGIGFVKALGEARSARLEEKKQLVKLELDFGYDKFSPDSRVRSRLLLEGLKPHPNLKFLEIRRYCGATVFPCWMASLCNLKSLVLEDCLFVERLGSFGKLPSLESLALRQIRTMKRVGVEFLGLDQESDKKKHSEIISFPKLKQLQFDSLEDWEEWEPYEDHGTITIMPNLVSLAFDNCPCLKTPLPKFLRKTPIRSIIILGCPLLGFFCQEGLETVTEETVKILKSLTSKAFTFDTSCESTFTTDDAQTSGHQEIPSGPLIFDLK